MPEDQPMFISEKSIGIKSRVISTIVFLAAILFYLVLFWTFKEKIPKITISALSLSVLCLSILLSAFTVGLGATIWLFLLRDHKVFVKPIAAIGMYAVSQFGKYLPGNIGQHVGRVLLAQRDGISIHVTFNTMIVEALWGMAVGFGLGLFSIHFITGANGPWVHLVPGKFELILLIALLLALPWIGIHFINTFFPGLAKRLTQDNVIPLPRVSTAIIVSALFVSIFFIVGMILKFQAQWIFGVTEGSVLEFTCLFAVAWLAGYLTPGAPGGMGVREVMMVLMFSPILGAGAAVGLGVTLRVTTMMGDAAAFGLGMLARKFAP